MQTMVQPGMKTAGQRWLPRPAGTFRLFPWILLWTASCLAPVTQAALEPRIIGGSPAGNGEYPFMVALVWTSTTSSDFNARFCGGTLVGSQWVLTAGHCVTADNGQVVDKSTVAVITGVTTLDTAAASATRIEVDAILRHPGYNNRTLYNDLALLHLAIAQTTDAQFAPDDDSVAAGLLPGDDLVAIGWGLVAQDDPATTSINEQAFDPTLQAATLDFIAYSTCNNAQHYNGRLGPDMLCAGFLLNPPRDTCLGDSGGPLLKDDGMGNRVQVGITSYGDSSGCAQMAWPGVYTRVGRYHGYITGAQSQADLAVSVAVVPGPITSGQSTVRFTVQNKSPFNAGTGITLQTSRSGNLVIAANTGSCSDIGGDLACTLADLAAGEQVTLDITVQFTGSGIARLTGTASAVGGDYDDSNDSATKSWGMGIGRDDSGTLPAQVWLLLSGLLALRRPGAGFLRRR